MAIDKLKAKLIKQMLEKGFYDIKKVLEIDGEKGKISIKGERMLITSSLGFANLHGSVEKIAGKAAPAIIRAYGGSCAKRDFIGVWKAWLPDIKMETVLSLFSAIYSTVGWGKVVDISLGKDEGMIVFKNCFEADAVLKTYGKRDGPQCHFVTGYLEVLFSEMTGKDWQVTETKCEAKEDEFCEFQIILK